MSSILIIGNGNWGKKVLSFNKKFKIFKKIYVKNSKNLFIIKKKSLQKLPRLQEPNKYDFVHICSPLSTHFDQTSFYSNQDNLIVEKPFLNNMKEFQYIKKKTNKRNRVTVNYIDLYSHAITKIKKIINYKINKIEFHYSNWSNVYSNKYLCIEDWLEHPLSLILFLFKKFSKFKILNFEIIKGKNNYLEKIEIEYKFVKKIIVIKINYNKKKIRKIIFYKKNKVVSSIDLNTSIVKHQVKKNLIKENKLENLYKHVLKKRKARFQSFNFYEKILKERIKIMNKIKLQK